MNCDPSSAWTVVKARNKNLDKSLGLVKVKPVGQCQDPKRDQLDGSYKLQLNPCVSQPVTFPINTDQLAGQWE